MALYDFFGGSDVNQCQEFDHLLGPARARCGLSKSTFERFFAVNHLIQEWTALHLAFHSLGLIATKSLITVARTQTGFLCTTALSLVGLASVVVSLIKDQRNEGLRAYLGRP